MLLQDAVPHTCRPCPGRGRLCREAKGFLARAQVYAPTIPGFGRSEKPALPYTQGLWQAFLRDFVVEVVRRPVVVAGNSIGGFLSASLAGGSPRLVRGAPHWPSTSHARAALGHRVAHETSVSVASAIRGMHPHHMGAHKVSAELQRHSMFPTERSA